MPENRKLWFPVFAAITIAYVALRLWRLTDSCLWFDEVFSLHAAGLDFGSLFELVSADLIHPALFYILLKIWISIGGESLFWVRFFPVLFSILALVPFYGLAKQLKLSNPAIALALSFFTVNGYLIKYAQEVRMYSLLMFLALVSVWLFARLLNTGKGIWILAITNILLVNTHYFGWLVIISEIVAVLIIQKEFLKQTLLMTCVTVLSFIPWAVAVLQKGLIDSHLAQNLGWVGRPGLIELFRVGFNLIEPFYYKTSSIGAFSQFIFTVPLLLAIFVLAGVFLAGKKEVIVWYKNEIILLAVLIATPLMISFIVSWLLPLSVWGTRHFIILFAPFALLIGKFFDGVAHENAKKALAAVFLFLFAIAFLKHLNTGSQNFIWCGWENVAQEAVFEKSARIYAFEDEAAYLLWFALRDKPNINIVKVNGIPEIIEDKAYFLPRGFGRVEKTTPEAMNGDHFYIAFRSKDFDQTKEPLKGLVGQGYIVGRNFSYQAQGLSVFLVEIKKPN